MSFISRFLFTVVFASLSFADVPLPDGKQPARAEVASISTDELKDYASMPAPVQALITRAIELTKKNLTYRFGSSDPSLGGMDCSGTIYRLLQDHDIKDTPRQSNEMAEWLKEKSVFHRAEDVKSIDDQAFQSLAPGDLLFWSGTYDPVARKSPVTHVMLYVGKRGKDNKPVIFGASDGRSYEGQKRCGVSIFDFKLPKPGDKAQFLGFGPVPGLLKKETGKAVK